MRSSDGRTGTITKLVTGSRLVRQLAVSGVPLRGLLLHGGRKLGKARIDVFGRPLQLADCRRRRAAYGVQR